ncbi:hypothetical protein [Microbacterium sp. NPDC057944]|uniref:hypothetical protein n=1 Tax=Microbacterium sp. NPDC057944 TaxID=3346286 RepID=UPI0036DE1BFC
MIALAMIGAGASSLGSANEQRLQTQRLMEQGHQATVSDARVKVFQGSDGERRGVEVEVTFSDVNAAVTTATLRTTPTIPVAISGPDGWEDEFPGKADIVGAEVRYLPGAPATVELESELSAQAASGWGFFDIFGIALCAMGGIILVIVLTVALRSRRGIE